MTRYLLDTNLLSELIRERPDPGVLRRLKTLPKASATTSVICIMELRHGASRHPHGARLWERIEREVLSKAQILPFGARAATIAGDLLARLQGRGEPIGVEDVQIAATALEHGLAVATRNVRHFSRIPGLTVESWWEG